MNPHYPAVARRAGHRCEYCRAPEAIFNLAFEVEHVCPIARGGSSDVANRALACRACNLFKADQRTGWDEATRAHVGLFDPRTDHWDLHFQADLDSGVVHGLTPSGRATVHQLKMNEPVRVAARLIWIRLRLFP
jgi:hypothetical protein